MQRSVMDVVADLELVILLGVANGVPLFAKNIFGARWDFPLDFGAELGDGRRLLGASKTFRGILLSALATAGAAQLLVASWRIGLLIAFCAMLGDIISSFIKRRMGAPVSSMALGLDQIPESLVPALAVARPLGLSLWDIALVCAVFLAGELVISRILFQFNLRDRPY